MARDSPKATSFTCIGTLRHLELSEKRMVDRAGLPNKTICHGHETKSEWLPTTNNDEHVFHFNPHDWRPRPRFKNKAMSQSTVARMME